MTTLEKIVKEAKEIKKNYPKKFAKWTDYIKEASKKLKGSFTKKKIKLGATKKTKMAKKPIKYNDVAKRQSDIIREEIKSKKFIMPHGYEVRRSKLGANVFNKEILNFLNKEGKKSKGFTYRAKVLWGQEIVLKEKNGTPIQKFAFDNFELCLAIAKELNKGQKYTKVKLKK